ncbi:hypothetical protein Dimus_015060 [Dionaea muscipula]
MEVKLNTVKIVYVLYWRYLPLDLQKHRRQEWSRRKKDVRNFNLILLLSDYRRRSEIIFLALVTLRVMDIADLKL